MNPHLSIFAAVFAAHAFFLPAPLFAQAKQNPPAGVTIPEADRAELTRGVAALGKEIEALQKSVARQPQFAGLLPDVQIFHKAVDWALRFDEFMDVKQVASAKRALAEGLDRAKALKAGKSPWTTATGAILRGYISQIDGSVQPYAIAVPDGWKADAKAPAPLLVWLAGRNEKRTELGFLDERAKSKGEIVPAGALVLHPYGRFCNATKFAGETDVFEALASVKQRYPIAPAKIAMGGFSMGGGSAWHLGAHHAGLWCAITPGAGFAESEIYLNNVGKTLPPWERTLFRLYNANGCAVNFGNTPTLAYAGELDKQKQSSDIMEKAMADEGLKLERLIGPGAEHKYEPESKKQLIAWLEERLAKGAEALPLKVKFATFSLRYPTLKWITLNGLEQHWERAEVDAEMVASGFQVKTKNVSAFTITLPAGPSPLEKTRAPQVTIDGQAMAGPAARDAWAASFRKVSGKWVGAPDPVGASAIGDYPPMMPPANPAAPRNPDALLAKRAGLTGPIDDAFMSSFIFVKPTGKPLHEKVGAWALAEMERAMVEWRRVFRGEVRVKEDRAITAEDVAGANLVLWGDPGSNSLLARMLPKLPLQWTRERLTLGKESASAADHAPVLIFPNPVSPQHYVVVNSGFTFRSGSAQSNANQTPKLPDWALIDLRTPPDENAPGAVVNAGFFDERWQWPKD